MILETKIENEQMQVSFSGSIYVKEAMEIRETFIALINQGQKFFLFDLSQVDYIDSPGLGVMVLIHKRASRNGGNLKIRGLQGIVKDLFELTRLNKVFEILE
jgi:anti-sigma B factor antagonist